MYSVPDDRPLDPVTLHVVRDLHDACTTLGIAYMLVGARARDLLLTHVFGFPVERATRDIDVAVAVPDWPTFDRITTWLAAYRDGWSPPRTLRHRATYHVVDTPGHADVDVDVDVVPFGAVENPPTTITWPPDGVIRMNVAGFAEALRHAAHVRIAPDLRVPVASLPGLAMLKLFAWADRRLTNAKDAGDLLLLLHRYAEAGNEDRLYAGEMDILKRCDYNFEIAGAYLLGADVAVIADPATRTQISALLNDAHLWDRLVLDLARGGTYSHAVDDDSLTAIDSLLSHFVAGLSSRP